MKLKNLLLVLVIPLFLFACSGGDDDDTSSDTGDGTEDSGNEAQDTGEQDTTQDTGAQDSGDEAHQDAETDAGNEGEPDTGTDAGIEDANEDAGVDTGVDSGEDTGGDAGDDTGVDASEDVGDDVGEDTGADASDDGGEDAGEDVGEDAGEDAGDVGPDVGYNPNPPLQPVKLIFIHHSTGQNWLNDDHGKLGLELMNNNYFVSDTNYGWGPDSIGDRTDIGNWWEWFRGPSSATYLDALYQESGQNSSYSRLNNDPSGENEIVMFKSCFPNSALQGEPDASVPAIANNPLKGESAGSGNHTVANAKGIYIDLLNYFKTKPDKLFIVIAAPPLQDPTYADNARAFNQWLYNEWLKDYPLNNVAVFDFYNVLTSNGGSADKNDLDEETGNHHRWWNNEIQHKTDGGGNTLAYPSSGGDDHPSPAGGQKASKEYVKLLNIYYHLWKGN